jgi:low affinity Fe/Cu permease
MASTWLKIKMWTRLTLISVVLLYLLVFIIKNRDNDIKISVPLVKEYNDLNVLVVMLLTAVFSIFGWWLLKTVLRAVRQIKDINRKAKIERMEREHSDMLAKASKLQTRAETTHTPPS